MDKEEFAKEVLPMFTKSCNWAGSGHYTFTETERLTFFTKLHEFFEQHHTKPDFVQLTNALITTHGKFES